MILKDNAYFCKQISCSLKTNSTSTIVAKFIDITTHGGSRDGGQDGSPSKAVVREYLMDMHHMCLGMKDLEAAMPTLYLMEKCLRKNGIRDPELLSLPSLVEDYFRKKNEPQPSTKIDGCNLFYGDIPDARIVGQDQKIGQLVMDNHGNINNKEKKPEE